MMQYDSGGIKPSCTGPYNCIGVMYVTPCLGLLGHGGNATNQKRPSYGFAK